MTLLSLSRRRNSVIESLHTFTHEQRNWFERLKLRFPEQEQTDYASIRIYWKYTHTTGDDVQMVERDEESKEPARGPPEHKGYFLFSGNRVQQLECHDYSIIRKYINKRLSEHQKQTLRAFSAAKVAE